MKLKDVCQQTGLTQKTIRLYEEKQLFSPASVIKNGRSYREYSEDDIKALQEIAVLRKSLFSLDEIYTIQHNPEEISQLLQTYTLRIREAYEHLKFLNHTLDTLEPETITNISQLAKELSGAARQLPLPAYDKNPKFRYLDAMEQPPVHVTHQDNLDEMYPGKQAFNQMVIGRMKGGSLLISANQITATRKARQGDGWVPVWEQIPEDPPLLRISKKILSVAIIVLIIYFIWNWISPYDIYQSDFSHLRLPCLIFCVAFVTRLTIALYQHHQRQKAWIDKHGNH